MSNTNRHTANVPRTIQPPDTMTVKDVADLFGVGHTLVGRWVQEGRLTRVIAADGHKWLWISRKSVERLARAKGVEL